MRNRPTLPRAVSLFFVAFAAACGDNPPSKEATASDEAAFGLGGGIDVACDTIDDVFTRVLAGGVAVGYRIGGDTRLGSYTIREFTNAAIIQRDGGCAFEMHGNVYAEWKRLGPVTTNALGAPTSNQSTHSTGGVYNRFERGAIYAVNGTAPAHEIHGAIFDKFAALGGLAGYLGYPTTATVPTGMDPVSHVSLGDHQDFQGGSIYAEHPIDEYWYGTRRVSAIHAPIRDKWIAFGGRQSINYFWPSGDTIWWGDGAEQNNFEGRSPDPGGSIYTSPRTTPHGLYDRVIAKWNWIGGGGSVLGYPTSDAQLTTTNRSEYAYFEHGSIFVNPALPTNSGFYHDTFYIDNGLHTKWKALGAENGQLGYPQWDPVSSVNSGTKPGRYQPFDKGYLYQVGNAEAHAILFAHGMLGYYWAKGDEHGPLGYPIEDAVECRYPGSPVRTYQNFEGGHLESYGENGELSTPAIYPGKALCTLNGGAICEAQEFFVCESAYVGRGMVAGRDFAVTACDGEDAAERMPLLPQYVVKSPGKCPAGGVWYLQQGCGVPGGACCDLPDMPPCLDTNHVCRSSTCQYWDPYSGKP
jgi:LGFP repeat